MAKVYNVNIVQTNGGCTHMYYFKETLKSAGWTVSQSSDGDTLYPSSDGITTDSSGSGGMDNSFAWFFIKDPANRRGIIAQRATGSLGYEYWRIITYENVSSSAGIFSGSTAAIVPGVSNPNTTGQMVLVGSGTTAAPGMARLFIGNNSHRSHTIAMDVPVNGVYPYYSFTNALGTGTGVVRNIFYADPVVTGTLSDASPVVHRCQRCQNGNSATFGFEYDSGVNVGESGWNPVVNVSHGNAVGVASYIHMFGTAYQVLNIPAYFLGAWMPTAAPTGNGFFPTGNGASYGSSAANSFSEVYDNLWPMLYGNGTGTGGSGYGYKGFSYYIKTNSKWKGGGTGRKYPDTINLATDAYVQAGGYCLPWPENVVAIA